MFPGRNNNDMLKRFMDCVGPFSTKMIRRHIASFTKLGLVPHFEPIVEGANNFHFRRQEVDKVTGMPVVRLVGANAGAIVSKQITQVLLKSRSASDSRGDVIKFADFLSKCLTLDPLKRISLETIMDHDFFKSKSNPM
jgi:serine/threonine-protein kinase PRP4